MNVCIAGAGKIVPSDSSGQELDYMRVEFGKLDSGIISSKLPKDFPAKSILCAGPGTDSSSKGFCVRLGRLLRMLWDCPEM